MSRRYQKSTLRVDPRLAEIPGGFLLAETIEALGGSVSVAPDGELALSVPDVADAAAKRAIERFERT